MMTTSRLIWCRQKIMSPLNISSNNWSKTMPMLPRSRCLSKVSHLVVANSEVQPQTPGEGGLVRPLIIAVQSDDIL